MGLQLAIGDMQYGNVSLWCVDRGFTSDGGQKFWVINGHWAGVYRHGEVIIDEDGLHGTRFAAKLLWRGITPFADEDYNEAMGWLRDQLRRKPELKQFFEGMKFNMTKLTFDDAVSGIQTEQHNERVTSLATAYSRITDKITALEKQLALANEYKDELATKGATVETLSAEDFSALYNKQFEF